MSRFDTCMSKKRVGWREIPDTQIRRNFVVHAYNPNTWKTGRMVTGLSQHDPYNGVLYQKKNADSKSKSLSDVLAHACKIPKPRSLRLEDFTSLRPAWTT